MAVREKYFYLLYLGKIMINIKECFPYCAHLWQGTLGAGRSGKTTSRFPLALSHIVHMHYFNLVFPESQVGLFGEKIMAHFCFSSLYFYYLLY